MTDLSDPKPRTSAPLAEAAAAAKPSRERPPEPAGPAHREVLDLASETDDGDAPATAWTGRGRNDTPSAAPARRDDQVAAATHPASAAPTRLRRFVRSAGITVVTLALIGLAIVAALVIWNAYVTAPWTRDGRIRVQVASVTPQVSGQITELRVADNEYVHKGDILYAIDPFDFEVALHQAQTQLKMKAADLQVKRLQFERRQRLTDLATTAEEQQQYAGNATQAQAAFEDAQQQVNQAEINLNRTKVTSPVNGFVTNLLMRVGDYAHAGTSNISVIDSDSFWVDGYFEETKMAHVCVGDRAEAQLMGYREPIVGHVQTVTRGISVSDAAPSTQGLPNVDPVYTWVRLAQRVPVRIAITHVPPGVPLVSGMTATVSIGAERAAATDDRWQARFDDLGTRLHEIWARPKPRPDCVPAVTPPDPTVQTLPTPNPPPAVAPSQINPGLTPGLTAPPRGQ